jgi:hypothetical protein
MEFKGKIKNGVIKIPPKYKKYNNADVKVKIIERNKRKSNFNPERIRELIELIHKKKFFSEIKDPVEWQKNIRNDWR